MKEDETLRFTSKVFQKGRITLPQWLREHFDIKEGDYIEIEIKTIRNVSKILRKKGKEQT